MQIYLNVHINYKPKTDQEVKRITEFLCDVLEQSDFDLEEVLEIGDDATKLRINVDRGYEDE